MRTGPIPRKLAILAMILGAQCASALELGLLGATSNLHLPWTPIAPVSGDVFPDTNYYWGGEAWMTAPLGDDASIRVSYEIDPITRNSLIAAVQFDRGIARISVGPRIGFLNSASSPFSAGLSASVRLQWPGVAYVSMRSDGGTSVSILQLDSDPQARTELAAGIYVPHAIVSGIISARRFSELDAGGDLVTDSLTRYAMTIDVFKKNVPYTALISLGYELRSKHYSAPAPSSGTTDSLGAIVLGLDSTVQLGDAFKLIGGISTGAYVFGLDALKGRGPSNSSFLFTADVGVSVDTAAIRIPPKRPKAEAEQPPKEEPKEAEPAPEKPAEPEPSPDTSKAPKTAPKVSTGVGFLYDAYPLTGTVLDIALAIFNLRGGLWGDLMFPLGQNLALGPEAGAYYIATTSGISMSLFDIPLNAKIEYALGKIKLAGFTGLFATASKLATTDTPTFGLGIDAGARIRLGGFFVEGSYVLGLSGLVSFPRFGLGYTLDILK